MPGLVQHRSLENKGVNGNYRLMIFVRLLERIHHCYTLLGASQSGFS